MTVYVVDLKRYWYGEDVDLIRYVSDGLFQEHAVINDGGVPVLYPLEDIFYKYEEAARESIKRLQSECDERQEAIWRINGTLSEQPI